MEEYILLVKTSSIVKVYAQSQDDAVERCKEMLVLTKQIKPCDPVEIIPVEHIAE